jgi:hypothetical protein
VIHGITVTDACRKGRIYSSVGVLDRLNIWVCPGCLRISDLLDDEADEVVTEIMANMRREIPDPRIHPASI